MVIQMERKIHCIEVDKEGFDELSTEEVSEMIGFVEPLVTDAPMLGEGETIVYGWDVTCNQGNYTAKEQDTAEILAGVEECKAMLKQLLQRK